MLKSTVSCLKHPSISALFILFSILICFRLPAQVPETGNLLSLPVTAYNVDEGLGQSTVYDLVQDTRGLIWLVSGGGLQYFDGSGFRSFFPDDVLAGKLPGNTLRGMIRTSPGELILSTGNSILHFDLLSGKFRMPFGKTPHLLLLSDHLCQNLPICWIYSEGLHYILDSGLSPADLKFRTGDKLPKDFNPLKTFLSPDGNLMILGGTGLLELFPAAGEADTLQAKYHPMNLKFSSACNDYNGQPFLCAEGKIYLLKADGSAQELWNSGVRDGYLLLIDRSDHFWISDLGNKKIYRLKDGRKEQVCFTFREGRYTDTIQPAVRHIFEDKTGNLWFGTDGNGLLLYSPGQFNFNLSLTGFSRCLEEFEREIWTGTYKNGLWRSTGDLSIKTRIRPDLFTNDYYFYDLFADTSGRLWTVTDKGVFILAPDGSVLFRFPFETSAAKFLPLPGGEVLLSIYGQLFSCTTGPKPAIIPVREQTFIRELIVYENSVLTGSDYGLFKTDTTAGILTALNFNPEDRLTEWPVYCILPMDEIFWIGTEYGIELFSANGEKIPSPEFFRELRHEIIYSLLKDSGNRVWFASNKGLGCIPADMTRIVRFSAQNNLQSSEFNFNAWLESPGGHLYFGGIKGINGLPADRFILPKISPEARLLSLAVSDSTFSGGIPPEGLSLSLNWKAPHVNGTVFNPEYLPNGTLSYSFLLEGLQEKWSKPSSGNSFSYRNLPPGEYNLLVKCIDSFKNEGNPVSLLRLVIRPPFWKTWWFISLLFLSGFMLTAFLIRRMQEIKFKTRLSELERRNAVDRERLRISQDMHDELGSSLTQIAILSEILKKQKSPDEMLTMIDKISGISRSVIDDLGEIIWAMNPKNDNLASFASYLRQHASEYLANAGITGLLSFPGEFPAIPMSSEQRRNIYLVVKEALNNAVKHSGATAVTVTLHWDKGTLQMQIKDNGRGFKPMDSLHSGYGLQGMRKRTESLGGHFTINSEPGKGTEIYFNVEIAGTDWEREEKNLRKPY